MESLGELACFEMLGGPCDYERGPKSKDGKKVRVLNKYFLVETHCKRLELFESCS